MWGQIIGAGIGMLGQRKAAKDQNARQAATDALNREGWDMAKPYIDATYKSGQEELNKIKASGPYGGAYFAGPNAYATDAYNKMGGYVPGMMDSSFGMMNTGAGFGANYGDLYNRASGATTLADAQQYAAANSGGMVDAAMRDPRRQLEEQTLTGIDKNAAMSGNTNNTRAMMASAIANRGFNDRQADVTADIQSKLRNEYTNQANTDYQNAMSANAGLMNAYNTGFGGVGDAMAYGVGAGEGLSNYDQAKMDADKAKYYNDLYFNQNANKDFSSGILSNAQFQPPTAGGQTADPFAAGIGGMMGGFGMGGKVQDWWRRRPSRPMQSRGGASFY